MTNRDVRYDPVPRLRRWLERRAAKTPYTTIYRDQDAYMLRGWVFNADWHWNEWRLFGVRWLRWMPAARLHTIMEDDEDPHFHDHPWPHVSILLRNRYLEWLPHRQRQHPAMDKDLYRIRWRSPLRPIFRRASSRHRITLPTGNEPVTSLFIMLPKTRDWGFWTPKGWVYWRIYLQQRWEKKNGKLD